MIQPSDTAVSKVYVGMALTHAPADYRDVFQVELKEKLRRIPSVEVLDFF